MTNTNEQNLDLEYKAQMFDALIQAGVEKLPVFKTALALFNCEETEMIKPTYYVRHPDETYSVADPQPVVQAEQEQMAADEREKYALFAATFKPDFQSFYPVEIQIANAIRNGDVK